MSHPPTNPPRLVQALLVATLKPRERESIAGDLLEEYRETKRPSLGRLQADIWYTKHVLSVVWRMVWPAVAAVVALRLLSFPLPGLWNPSLVPAPGVSLLDATILLWAGLYGARRTASVAAGILAAGAAALAGCATFFVYAAAGNPSLLRAPFQKPTIFLIVAALFSIALGFGLVFGATGALIGRWLSPANGTPRLN